MENSENIANCSDEEKDIGNVNESQEYSEKSLPNIGDSPNQPSSSFKFKKTKISGQNRCCSHNWFPQFEWLHYSENEDKLYCFYCVKSLKEGKLSLKNEVGSNIDASTKGLMLGTKEKKDL